MQCVSSVTEGTQSIDALRARLEGIVFAEPPLLPSCNAPISRTMVLTTTFLRALRDGRDPIDSARAADLGYIPSTMSTELKPYRPYELLEELRQEVLEGPEEAAENRQHQRCGCCL